MNDARVRAKFGRWAVESLGGCPYWGRTACEIEVVVLMTISIVVIEHRLVSPIVIPTGATAVASSVVAHACICSSSCCCWCGTDKLDPTQFLLDGRADAEATEAPPKLCQEDVVGVPILGCDLLWGYVGVALACSSVFGTHS